MKEQEIRPPGSNSKQTTSNRSHLFIISAPSGGGKTTLSKAVVDRFKNILYSVSYTTRSPRNSEQDGVDYYFIPKKDFQDKIEKGHWAERGVSGRASEKGPKVTPPYLPILWMRCEG